MERTRSASGDGPPAHQRRHACRRDVAVAQARSAPRLFDARPSAGARRLRRDRQASASRAPVLVPMRGHQLNAVAPADSRRRLWHRRVAVVCILGTLLSSRLTAQTLRVRILDSLSSLPVPGAVLSAVDTAGRSVSTVLTSEQGTGLLQVGGAGRYTIAVRRIGFRPFVTGELTIRRGLDTAITLVLLSQRAVLPPARVTAHRQCDAEAPSPSAEAEPLWEEVRKALEATVLTRTGSLVTTEIISVKRLLSTSGRVLRSDSLKLGTRGERPYFARSEDELAESGYVQGNVRSGFRFFAPDEYVLLSDGFANRHCLSMAGSVRRDSRGVQLGVSFEPRRTNLHPDIRGTIWVDSASSELRQVEFVYVNVSPSPAVNGASGEVRFERTTGGAWIVSQWAIRMPRFPLSNIVRGGTALEGYTEVGGATRVVGIPTARRP
jgi:hypothetical protein